MQLRKRAIHVTLVVACLATVATSPAVYEMTDAAVGLVNGPGVSRVRVLVNDVAADEATGIHVEFKEIGNTSGSSLRVVPDDPALDPFTLVDEQVVDAFMLCADVGSCEIGFNLDLEAEGAATIEVTAVLTRAGGASPIFPQDGEFSEDALVEVRFDQ
jgi:hypothetical protein